MLLEWQGLQRLISPIGQLEFLPVPIERDQIFIGKQYFPTGFIDPLQANRARSLYVGVSFGDRHLHPLNRPILHREVVEAVGGGEEKKCQWLVRISRFGMQYTRVAVSRLPIDSEEIAASVLS